jgi:IS5 family transposase
VGKIDRLRSNLSDPAGEEALDDSVSMRNFVGIDLGTEGAPDETTVCKFRHLVEKHKLRKKLLTSVNDHLRRSGIKITTGGGPALLLEDDRSQWAPLLNVIYTSSELREMVRPKICRLRQHRESKS